MRAALERRDRHRLMQRVRGQYLDEIEVGAQQVLEVARGERVGVLRRAARKNRPVRVAQRRDLRLRMIAVAAHIEIKHPAKADEADTHLWT